MTPEAARLRALAERIGPRVAGPTDAVAITGSVARGNAREDSDLDLWILGRRSGRFTRRFGSVSVTLLCQRPDEAVELENLCLFEVDDLVVLSDPRGQFARLLATWKRHRKTIRNKVREATRAQLAWELSRAEGGSPEHRAAFLRIACWRRACLWLFEQTGWRVPRLGTLFETLPPEAVSVLREALALPSARQGRAGVRLLPRAVRELHVRDGYRLPESVFEKEIDEAAFLARRELIFELVPRAFAPFGVTDLKGLELFEARMPALVAAFRALEPGGDERTVRRLRENYAELNGLLR